MRIAKALTIRDQVEQYLLRIYKEAETKGWTHDELLKHKKKWHYDHFGECKLPRWLISSIDAMDSILFHQLYNWPNPKLEYRHVWKEETYPDWNSLPEEAKEFVRAGGKLESHHYWISSRKVWA